MCCHEHLGVSDRSIGDIGRNYLGMWGSRAYQAVPLDHISDLSNSCACLPVPG
jgi:hypothetical protein